MDDQNSTPRDMWPDEEPISPQNIPTDRPIASPTPQPMTPPVSQPQGGPLGATAPATSNPKPPRRRSPWTKWVITIIVLAILALAGGYVFGKYWPTIQSWWPFGKEEATITNTTVTDSQVAWQDKESIGNLNLLTGANPDGVVEDGRTARYYKVGQVISGSYKDGDLIVAALPIVNEMMGPIKFYRLIKKTDGSLVMLTKQSPDLFDGDGIDRSKFTLDNSYQIASLYFPNTIKNPNPNGAYDPLVLQDSSSVSVNDIWFDDWAKNFRKSFTDSKWGDVYTDKEPASINRDRIGDYIPDYGFYLKAPDGSIRVYAIEFTNILGRGTSSNVPMVTWTSSNKLNSEEYTHTDLTGCGSADFASVMPNSLIEGLIETGRASDDQAVYELKDTNHQLLQDLFGVAKSNPAFSNLTYQQFLKDHPIFFWKDSFSRLIKFQIQKYAPVAECGKPVIYLYPEKTTRVSVKVDPVGGFSFTDPAYGNGWEVIARPDGVLTEIKSNKTYPYLFWEGRGGLYQAPTLGWVVKQAEVSSFLDDKLAQMGLNAKETADFKEFWIPRMQGAPYYQVGFWGNAMMNQIAPLNITPKPDTTIRVLMDFKPLQKPVVVKAPTIKTPERRGFTVVEWGGVIQ